METSEKDAIEMCENRMLGMDMDSAIYLIVLYDTFLKYILLGWCLPAEV